MDNAIRNQSIISDNLISIGDAAASSASAAENSALSAQNAATAAQTARTAAENAAQTAAAEVTATVVGDWLTSHVNPATGYVIDN